MAVIHGIVAVDTENGIGFENKLLFRHKEDLTIFKEKTRGKPIVMGRKTLESLPRLLPERKHIVFTRNKDYLAPEGVIKVHSGLDLVNAFGHDEEIWIIGGSEIYSLLENWVDIWHITRFFESKPEKDAYFSVDLSEFEKLSTTKLKDGAGEIEVWKRTTRFLT